VAKIEGLFKELRRRLVRQMAGVKDWRKGFCHWNINILDN
jgi:hypothetical protein